VASVNIPSVARACAAVMGITEIVSHGRAEAQPTSHSGSRPVMEPESVPLDRAPALPAWRSARRYG
jgi:hypothetical protein